MRVYVWNLHCIFGVLCCDLFSFLFSFFLSLFHSFFLTFLFHLKESICLWLMILFLLILAWLSTSVIAAPCLHSHLPIYHHLLFPAKCWAMGIYEVIPNLTSVAAASPNIYLISTSILIPWNPPKILSSEISRGEKFIFHFKVFQVFCNKQAQVPV